MQVLQSIRFIINAGDRAGLVGPNGVGKSTLLRLLMGQEEADSGSFVLAPGIESGYLPQSTPDFYGYSIQDQIMEALGHLLLLEEEMRLETYRYGQVGYEGEFVGRLIGYGLFRLEDMHKRVEQLSLGQKRKLEIARLMAREPNVLLLDEPTNYISLDVLEAFEAAMLAFPGPVLAISHDRWFIQRFGGVRWQLDDGRW